MSLEKIRGYLMEKLGTPGRDSYGLPTSGKRFPDGGFFRIELLPETVEEYEQLLSLCEKHNLVCNKMVDTRGTVFDTDEVIIRKCELCKESGIELMMAPGWGERDYDISHQVALKAMQSGKLRGMDTLVNNLADMIRTAELGCRGFLVYDEGMLYASTAMRRDGKLPPDTTFKLSAIVSVSNPLAAKFWIDKAGLNFRDSINPVRDLTLPMIAAMREAVDQPLDIHIFWQTLIARTLEAPEIVRIGSPVYLKNSRSGSGVTLEERVLQSIGCVQAIERYYPEAKSSPNGAEGQCIPAKPGEWSFE